MSPKELPTIRCHYEVLGVAQDADATVVKKAHRKLALKFHPDKNHGDDTAAEKFRLVQQAYEVLSDSQERKWYDDHRDAILAGWSAGGSSDSGGEMLFEVVHYMHPGCYSGYHDNEGGFFNVFTKVFEEIVQLERRQTQVSIELPTDFGNSETNWAHVVSFYQTWESFVSQLNFAWEDKFNANEDAPNRRVRRLMEEDNKKARRNAKKSYVQDILALVAFVKRRDPRVKAKQEETKQQKEEQIRKQKEEALERKLENQRAKEAWREQAHHDMKKLEEEDRLAGRVRLADLEDDYDYGGKKRGKKKKNKRRGQVSEKEEDEQTETQSADENEAGDAGGVEGDRVEAADVGEARNVISQEHSIGKDLCNASLFDTDDVDAVLPVVGDERPIVDDNDSSSEDSGPDFWRCECCGKDFKSEGQMSNHMKSKKHKENYKKFLAMIKSDEGDIMGIMMEELDLKERLDV